ncbi:MAG: ABC transporter ATP-binding protein [Chloroflexi bacterium]|nr:ABC transporter ATP-binding protein [Chloroflexota bacterium]OJW02759.1 MAG: multidrug ABC transporter ATP-binding protein [Chloroflexi bacterium 54-19]
MHETRKLLVFLKPYLFWSIMAPLMMVLEVSMDLLQPLLIQHIIDQGVLRSDLNVVVTTGLIMGGVALVGLLGGMGCTIFAITVGQNFAADLRKTLFRKVQSLSFGNLDRLETGSLITRLTNDVSQVQELVLMILRMIRSPLLLFGSLIMAILTSPQLAVLFIGLLPLLGGALFIIIRKTYPLFSEVQKRLDGLNTVMQENLAGVRVVKAFARAKHEISRFGRVNEGLMRKNTTAVRVGAITMPFMMLVLNAGVIAALWIGGNAVKSGSLQIGQLVAFINYLTQALMALLMVSTLIMRVSRAEASAERIQEVLQVEPDVQDRPGALTTFEPKGRVAFEDVTFSYKGAEGDPVLKGISFVAEPGQTVALLGATGAGKSSVVSLVPRFYDVSGGRVTIDGVDVRDIDQTVLHKTVGMALQESVLFSGTIRDNIRYGQPAATETEVIEAAKMAQAHDFISGFPDGYDTNIGQRGVNLSGGQKQRIAIARALLAEPAVLILDDSTSAVDVATEARIQVALAAQNRKKTCLVVAQRISTVLKADKILVLDDGKIVAEGTHAELLQTSPIYQEIYASQVEQGVVGHGAI